MLRVIDDLWLGSGCLHQPGPKGCTDDRSHDDASPSCRKGCRRRSALPLFVGALLSDWAYGATYEVQWTNFASWLLVGALLLSGIALLWSIIDLLRASRRSRHGLVAALLLLATLILGFINALVHSKDAWATMPEGLVLSVIVSLFAFAATLGGVFRSLGSNGVSRRALFAAAVASLAAGCGSDPDPRQYGPDPKLPEQQRGLLPSMEVASPGKWGDQRPTVPQGYVISAIATNLKVPRQTLVLPNGDILVAEGKGGKDAPALRPKDFIAGYVMEQGSSTTEGGDRLTLLRDADGDGTYEGRTVFAENRNAPYGLALARGYLYVANQDALVRFGYRPGQIRASGPRVRVTAKPAEINHHWTKALAASLDGGTLYVGIGSNSNVGERGLAVEENRAMVWAVDAATGAHRPFATGLRNPTALAVQPGLGQLWTVVNERDELGPNLVPDYLTSVRQDAFYGWPYSYWGQNVDPRVRPQDAGKVAATVRPDYSLGSHHAPLGLAFSVSAMGERFAEGVFIGEHGSWNRSEPVGYRVVFVPFRGGRPAGVPIEVATGFLGSDGTARGRPVGVSVDPRGALIIADDLANTIWRMAPVRAP